MSNFTAEARRRGRGSGGIPAGCDDRVGVTQRGARTSHSIYELISGVYRVLKTTLREIFDESAYERFIARTHSERSTSSYRAFMRERENAMARKQRCC